MICPKSETLFMENWIPPLHSLGSRSHAQLLVTLLLTTIINKEQGWRRQEHRVFTLTPRLKILTAFLFTCCTFILALVSLSVDGVTETIMGKTALPFLTAPSLEWPNFLSVPQTPNLRPDPRIFLSITFPSAMPRVSLKNSNHQLDY